MGIFKYDSKKSYSESTNCRAILAPLRAAGVNIPTSQDNTVMFMLVSYILYDLFNFRDKQRWLLGKNCRKVNSLKSYIYLLQELFCNNITSEVTFAGKETVKGDERTLTK